MSMLKSDIQAIKPNVTKPIFYSPQPVAKGKYDGRGIKCFLGGAQSDFCMFRHWFLSSHGWEKPKLLEFLATVRVKKTMFVACIFNADLTIRLANLI